MLSRQLVSRPLLLSCHSSSYTHYQQSDHNELCKFGIRRSSSLVDRIKNTAARGKNAYLKFLGRHFPTLYQYQMQVLNGVLDLKRDALIFFQMTKALRTGGKLSTYTRQELLAYQEISQQKIKLVPVVVITALPFSVLFLPLLFAWPGIFLTSHFMSDAQRTSVELNKLEHKLSYCQSVLDDFALKVEKLPSHKRSRKTAEEILDKLEKGLSIRVSEILLIADIFEDRKYRMHNIPYRYRMHLAHCNELRIKNVTRDNQIQFFIDKALAKSTASALTDSELKWTCFKHGANPTVMSRSDQVNYINRWIEFINQVNETHMPLLLHGVVFFGYNHPSNLKMKENLGLKWKRKSHHHERNPNN
ncbi:LETM1 domain-containing protein 1-like isoform X2 [Saccostrea echinata]|uniref:LETM1 domain-containing protein 1-like isoform X2 n=1 Tax=Saccostrea echinata TaxID=191078 RepID=UPI002A83F9C3|nr:LETM1 domain-containing protein 1-like isoform X2 [Saccostrea echinata]